MARKKKNDEGILGGILFIALIVAIIATPILLGWGYFSAKEKLDNADEDDFWLNQNEQNEFINLVKKQKNYQNHIHAAHELARQHQVKTNKDGSYSQRSNVGKQVVATLGQYEPMLSQTNNELSELIMLPQKRWREVNSAEKNFVACKWGGLIWIGTFIVVSIGAYFESSSSGQEPTVFNSMFVGALSAAVCSGTVYGITFWLNKGISESIACPPEVTVRNYQNANV